MTEDLVRAASEQEKLWGDWTHGRYAWVTSPVLWFKKPIPFKGAQGLWSWLPPAVVLDELEGVLAHV